MREIKFRAWRKEKEDMFEVSGFSFSANKVSLFTDTEAHFVEPLDQVILLQFTGLKDKNGKEIYEGDIVKTKNEGTFPIEWGDVGCDYHGGVGFGMGSENPIPSFYEVMGNIYDNPELLK